ncbi:hypothetical protein BgiMline_011812 [Biomphalaria glabrata]|uniref:Uncharacterized protein LOC106054998 n=1 Tax=Biomphalaria glabrata TaxID=6526 RepID=A0A9W3A7C5_BIOGL|nr:uncharacterized protein LOC106054998 [Biomphalaria glabrata]XP_055883094.1 uncharacterized protein LOC106054998 [Biomphalaria glabrata]KAI8728669.1 centromere protein P-like [Biomphalaria glabrata]
MNDIVDYSAFSKEELDEIQKVNNDRIKDLEKDIFLLERNLQQYGPVGLIESKFDISNSRHRSMSNHNSRRLKNRKDSSNDDELTSFLKDEIDNYTHRLKETAKLTGVNIENIERHVIVLDESQCIKQFHLELQILDRKVLVTYKLQEALSCEEADTTRNKLIWFEVKFTEDINNVIGDEVTKAVENVAIHSTFSLLKSYIQWLNLQEITLDRFLKTYPENVITSVNERRNCCLTIKSTKPNRPVFNLEWGRKVVVDRVDADIRLEVDAPEEVLALDSKHILESSPKIFYGMLEKLGPEKAIESLILLVATDGKGA